MTRFGTKKSRLDQIWIGPDDDVLEKSDILIKIAGLSEPASRVASRLNADPFNIESFTAPKIRDLLPNPFDSFLDMHAAATRIAQAIKGNEKIAIFADYDVDGATSAALLTDYLRHKNMNAEVYIPDRLTEGYGPNIPAMEMLAENASLIICVDCGTLSHDPIMAARKQGAEVIVLDHHTGGSELPDAIVVNPNRQDETSQYGYLCAAGVVFLTLFALEKNGRSNYDLIKALDLVAMATIADVAQLVDLNRAFIHTGLKVLNQSARPGVRALIDVVSSDAPIDAEAIGFKLGPRLNAGGRIGQSRLAFELLDDQNYQTAYERALKLEVLNNERRDIEAFVSESAMQQIEARENIDQSNIIWAAHPDWHQGVLGISASRVKSKFQKPSLVMAGRDLLHGSARSVTGVDLGAAIAKLVDEELIIKGGGHKMAAGVTLAQEQLEPAMERLNQLLARAMRDRISALHFDGFLSPSAVNLTLYEELQQFGPFGESAPPPIFIIPNLTLKKRFIIKDTHLRYQFGNSFGQIEVMAFHAVGSNLDINTLDSECDIAIKISQNFYRGQRKISILLEDILTN